MCSVPNSNLVPLIAPHNKLYLTTRSFHQMFLKGISHGSEVNFQNLRKILLSNNLPQKSNYWAMISCLAGFLLKLNQVTKICSKVGLKMFKLLESFLRYKTNLFVGLHLFKFPSIDIYSNTSTYPK